ncbi:hypothetical protein FHS89_000284 [Rubricella aquisinus]|uniref:DUF2239 family protein n=1 Tax=Rubricella aquisinus TaxID=2028108 RepID=A0A840WX67_9RHOB|nr:DUF2239 family protein [Rubricella aquisinus]MBB5514286.1 hypothetical protein [Rubricella aquisinus]
MSNNSQQIRHLIAFRDMTKLTSGPAPEVALFLKKNGADAPAEVFDAATGAFVDLDLSGTDAEVMSRHMPPAPPAKRGRPKLGVVAKEVTLLPRHWDWLAAQPGGASATLRRLIDETRKAPVHPVQSRKQAMARADRFMSALLGDQPGYEEAARALYAGDKATFLTILATWPKDPARFAQVLAAPAFDE